MASASISAISSLSALAGVSSAEFESPETRGLWWEHKQEGCEWLCSNTAVSHGPFTVSVTEIGIVSKTIAVINRLSCWDVKIKAAQL